jgi:hypothetical protein
MLEVFSWFLFVLECAAQSIMHLAACSRTLPGHCTARATNISLRLYWPSFQALPKLRRVTQCPQDHNISETLPSVRLPVACLIINLGLCSLWWNWLWNRKTCKEIHFAIKITTESKNFVK